MADASVTFLLENLTQLVSYHYNLISGADEELKQLMNDLRILKAFLEDASKKRKKEEVYKEWEGQITEVVYEVEDLIDTCLTNQAKAKIRFMGGLGIGLARQVRSLRNDKVTPLIAFIKNDFANRRIEDSPADTSQEEKRNERNKAPRQDNVVGFEDETDTLIKYLIEESDALEVISIIGMPGLGKTTLAWKIYCDPRIQYEFPTLIWVYVSQEFNKKDFCLTILKKFSQQNLSSKPVHELVKLVHEHLMKGKLLIFMDDVWTVEAWDEIQEILPKTNSMAKVLITSRDENVARRANKSRDPHKLRFLDREESWMLLQLEVFGKLDDFPRELGQVGKVIAEHCDGLPLAIIVIGGILVEKLSTIGGSNGVEKEWKDFSDNVKTYLIYDDKEKTMENIISLSYTKLPYDLRDCFLYFGMFPADTNILVWKLIRLWIAEGFIQPKPGKSLEEIAQNNLKDLINRNLVMVEKTKPDGEVKACRVHDMIREFCKNEVTVGRKNLFQEIRMSKQGVFEPPIQEMGKYRRICIHSYVNGFISGRPKVPNARSFLCFSKEPIILEDVDIPCITDAFSLLRVLEANTIKFPKFPAKLIQLIHLRYITLSGDGFKILPESISKLWNIQTIVVDTFSRTLQINADISMMTRLRHLKTRASIILNKEYLKGEGGENLQTLGRLSPQSCTDNVFNKAKNLKTLGVRGKLATVLDAKCFEKLNHLEKLKLVNDVFPKVASENPLHRLPESSRFPPKLKILVLSATYLDWTHMPTVGNICTLEVLKLKDNAFTGNSWDVGIGGFNMLHFLYIARADLKFWTAKGDSFPKLRSLALKNCEKLEGVPLVLGKGLDMLYMERVTKYAVVSAKKIQEAKKQTSPGARTGAGFKLVIAPGDE